MNKVTLGKIIAGAIVALVIAAAVVFGLDALRKRNGSAAEVTAHIASGEAIAHVSAAQAIPDHAQALQAANARTAATEAELARARAEVARVKRLLAAKPSVPVPDPAGSGSTVAPALPADHRDEVIAAQDVLIAGLETQNAALKDENGLLKVAFADEQKRTAEWKAAAEARERQALAQESATRAWRSAVKTAEIKGGVKGAIGWEILRRVLGVK